MNNIPPVFLPLIIILVGWSIAWKGVALWKAAQRGEKGWFVALLIVNTLGLLEMYYVLVRCRREPPAPTETGRN